MILSKTFTFYKLFSILYCFCCSNSFNTFLKPELPKDRAAYNVSVDEDGYKYYDNAKALAKKYKITIEDDSDDRNK